MRTLSVNIDHIATLRQARQADFPDPVQAAIMVELGGADGITVHLRKDRRHINERDVELLRKTIKTELTIEMAATEEMTRIASRVRPEQVTLVPELKTEVTTSGGLDVVKRYSKIKPFAQRLKRSGIRVSMFVEPVRAQIEAAARLGADVVELNTDRYCREKNRRAEILGEMENAAGFARELGLVVHTGHGLDYMNIVPILELDIAEGFSIGFAIVARALMVGLAEAVAEMKRIVEVYS
ncbi:pyridoxine 5'-phosphate synthase [candidate division WOR-3 bacterium JGI_Cruoil_03_51_56]|uniref:Pyridoxine 5'-phosphate synthase n=1 Tax=candidate division WOR-3 bacterium JGI_Cruoil_03_51_56 TaxID=1973747 RepID=A0A235BRR1_UNCW3|nr:MAG: pyridoxine 5'-phosphate synthase [candidate division WOR-3 bacterium JGI_Cruoil_03_51_56]